MADPKRILIYKRTHEGDPSADGCFGVSDCMGQVRGYKFDAVIGVGGVNAGGMALKVSWIGIGAHRRWTPAAGNCRGPTITFDHFCHFRDRGEYVVKAATTLAKRLYDGKARFLILGEDDGPEFDDSLKIIALAESAPPSRCREQRRGSTAACRCKRKCKEPCPPELDHPDEPCC